jgi:small-conductance mechanosensitive channel
MCGVREVNHMVLKLISVAIILGAAWGLTRVNHMIFKKLQSFREGLQIRFFVRFLDAIIMIYGIVIAISSFGGFESVWKTMLGGTAILSAILGFAGQDVIKDVLGGLMITLYKPFEIGNRIELEGEITGIVSDITMRHVVLKGLDTQCFIIPNSKLNAMRIRNYSYEMKLRSADFSFHIAYDSDVRKAIEVIETAIQESPCTVAGKHTKDGDQYASVYFMKFEDSSLLLRTTVYYPSTYASEVIYTDINLRVQDALKENGIEIPYQYINIIHCGQEKRSSHTPPRSV